MTPSSINARRQTRHAMRICAAAAVLALPARAFSADPIIWNASTDGFWGQALQWTPTEVPDTELESAMIDWGQATLDADYEIGNLILNGAVIAGDFDLTASASGTDVNRWTAGTIRGAGVATLNGPTEITGPASKHLDGGRTLVLSGSTLLQRGVIVFSDNDAIAEVLHNTGTLTVSDGADFHRSDPASPPAANHVFINDGTLVIDNNYAATNVTVAMHNEGSVSVENGYLYLAAGGKHAGTFRVESDLNFAGGNHTISAGATTGGGTVYFDDGQVSYGADARYDVQGTTDIRGGTVIFNSDAAVTTGQLQFHSGILDGSSDLIVNGDSIWRQGTMSGPGSTIINGNLILGGGQDHCLLRAGRRLVNHGTTTVHGVGLDYKPSGGAGAGIDNYGAFITEGAARIELNNPIGEPIDGMGFNNYGTFLINGVDNAWTFISGPFNNEGVLRVQSGLCMIRSMERVGEMVVEPGAWLDLDGIIDRASTIVVKAGAEFSFDGRIDTAASISGPGDIYLNGAIGGNGNLSISSPAHVGQLVVGATATLTLASMDFYGLRLGGEGTVVVNGDVRWYNGRMEGPGRTIINGDLMMTELYSLLKSGRVLVNNGNATLSGAALALYNVGGGGATFENNGSLAVTNDADILFVNDTDEPVLLANNGLFTKSGAGTITTVQTPMLNAGQMRTESGTLELAGPFTQLDGGRFTAMGGNVLAYQTMIFEGGILEGRRSIIGDVDNIGALISPGIDAPGRLSLLGNLSLGSESTVLFDIDSATPISGHDVLNTVSLELGGQIIIDASADYAAVASVGDTFEIAHSLEADLIGAFANAPSGGMIADGLMTFSIHYGTDSPFDPRAVVLVLQIIPEPATAGSMLMVLPAMIRRRGR